ncbi:FG-GAP repeat protein [Haloarcula laminariae]|uniref:FG-GAP repeat protein n=1 Tax=Haloarcula laminariae TaxID=2961577 RepID=UPI002405E4C8|nr:FG-GAP repeat protein [Halomicroarcula sp. FL173]
MTTHRRRFLRLCGVAGVSATAGCSTGSQNSGTPTSSQTTATPTESPTQLQSPTQQAKLVPDDGDNGDRFAGSVAVSSDGTTALVGAVQDSDPHGDRAGSAYIFDGSGGSWSQQAKITADDGDSDDEFGNSVALSSDGTTALIGAHEDDDPNEDGAGSAYIFDGSGGSWSQQVKLVADDGTDGDNFGRSVALSRDGTTALIGASDDRVPNVSGEIKGAVYIFSESSGSWNQQTKLAADDGANSNEFGCSVALSRDGTTALIGDRLNDTKGTNTGSAHIFNESGDSWSQQARLVPDDGDSRDNFGNTVALSSDGTTALIGSYEDNDPNGDRAGSAYLFDSSAGSWSQQAKLTAADGDSDDLFGHSVAIARDGTIALIGARYDEDPYGRGAGSAYIFDGSGDSWSQQDKISAGDGDLDDNFGSSVGMSSDGTTALIGASGDEDPNGRAAGSAYIFE